MSRSAIICAAVVCALGLALHSPSPARAADGNASWISAPAEAPAPPTGAAPSPYPLPVGYVGDIEFWAPNRGVLITAGNADVPAGLYAYDGVSWHELSTVCGGTDGRIAWAGPDDFWTISDQRAGQILTTSGTGAFDNVSLCHFLNGQVVASYAMPLQEPDSYKPMNAAACDSPSDCWFGGQLDANGAFHLHWDGSTVSVVDEPEDHEVAAMTLDNGQIFESVELAPTDPPDAADPPLLLHTINPQSPTNPFHPAPMFPANCDQFCSPLPDYGTDSNSSPANLAVAPVTLGGLALGSDPRAGSADPRLWAAAGPDGTAPPNGFGAAHPIVLSRNPDGTWTQVVPDLTALPGDDTPLEGGEFTPTPQSIAAEPALSAAWIAVQSESNPDSEAHVVRVALNPDGTAAVTDQNDLGTAPGTAGCTASPGACVGPKGSASAITCPAPQDCWLATSQGWLFHLTDGTQYPQDTDPSFQSVITFRPTDNGVPAVISDVGIPVSLARVPAPVTVPTQRPAPKRAKPLVSHIGSGHLIHRTTLVLPFTLTASAHVRLIARRHGRMVAQTPRRTFRAGRHSLAVRLNPHRWPTALALKATPAGAG